MPPVRDEESETQRKAHAKRVRETRRSTQGVTLEEIKSAEQLVKKKNQQATNNNNDQVINIRFYSYKIPISHVSSFLKMSLSKIFLCVIVQCTRSSYFQNFSLAPVYF